MHFLDQTLGTLAENLALDEALLLAAEAGAGEVLRLWEFPRPAVVVGAGGRLADEVNEPACRRAGIPVGRRSSGGGTVLLGPGCLLFTLVLDYRRDPALEAIAGSYAYILGRLAGSLADLVPGIEPAGTSDLAVGGHKCSGNAQHRKRGHLLHHGSLLYAFDVQAVDAFLPMPPRQPAYRRGRGHAAFLANLHTDRQTLSLRLCHAWGATPMNRPWPAGEVQRLVHEKYSAAAWVRRY